MWVMERRGAREPSWTNRPVGNRTDLNHPRRPTAGPRCSASTWRRCSSCSAPHTDGGPVYVSFVSKATLWDRGLRRHHPTQTSQNPLLSVCPRFLFHMKACPEHLRPPPPCRLSTKPRPRSPPQLETCGMQTLTTPKTQAHGDSMNSMQNRGLARGRRSAVVVPCVPVPSTSISASAEIRIDPTRAPHNTPPIDTGRQHTSPTLVPVSPLYTTQARKEEEEEDQVRGRRERGAVATLVTSRSPVMDGEQSLGRDESKYSVSPARRVSQGSLSDFSHPSSRRLGHSTEPVSGRSSALSGMGETDSSGSSPLSQLRPSSAALSVLSSSSLLESPDRVTPEAVAQPCQPPPDQGKTFQLVPLSAIHSLSNPSLNSSSHRSTFTDLQCHASTDPVLDDMSNPDFDRPLDSDFGLDGLASPSATWSSCPSPQRTTPRSRSGARLTPCPSAGWQEWTSHHWPVLPPISSVRGGGVSGWGVTQASHCSEVSYSHSPFSDELEAIALRTCSSLSQDHPLGSTGSPSPDTELSPGLAALTVGCDSGPLGCLSRVRLLLLDRSEPNPGPDPSDHRESTSVLDWMDHTMQPSPQRTPAGVLRPSTFGSDSERCHSRGKVREHKPALSEGGTGSPSSWIIDPSPSDIMFGSRPSSSKSSHTQRKEAPQGRSPIIQDGGNKAGAALEVGGGLEGRECTATEEERMTEEERETKVLDVLSKLHDDRPRQPNGNQGHSNFEDFDFLAKYCIFSQEKLAEYKRAFEAVDSDGDGYISCFQVLLALKNIVPLDMLSDEEEIYVYRILEMVDFRVTDGLTDLRLFAVIASLAQKIATMDEFMRSLVSSMDFRSLEVKLFKAKLFLFLLEGQAGVTVAQHSFIGAEQLLVELKAGGIRREHEEAIRQELQHMRSLDLLDFLAHLPLFLLIHRSIIANPLDDSSNL